ncbi:MAG: hypothetical protein ABFE07_25070, partial [Armatimonadia bacterium]
MAKTCPHCGEESDRDDLCTWCNKSIAPAKPAAQPAAQPGGQPSASAAPAKPTPAHRHTAQPASSSVPVWAYFAGLAVLVVLFAGISMFMQASKAAGPPPKPTDWKCVKSMTKLFSLEVPSNWKFTTAGSSASYEQIGVRGGKLYRVNVDGTGSKGAMGDIAGAAARVSGADSGSDISKRSEGRLHSTLGAAAQKKDPTYHEEDNMQACHVAGMPAAYSEYTATRKV